VAPSINANLDPEMITDRAYLLEATTAKCPRCETRFEIGEPLIVGWEDDEEQ
jgi:hypothetical protein